MAAEKRNGARLPIRNHWKIFAYGVPICRIYGVEKRARAEWEVGGGKCRR